MKKFVTTAFLGILSATCALAFTACGGSGDNKTTTYTVTDTEWKTAITLITGGKHTVACNWTTEEDNHTIYYTFQYDNATQALKLYYSEAEETSDTIYGWKSADKYYASLNDEVIETNKNEFDEALKANLNSYAGGFILTALSEEFSSFTYDEEKKEYSADISVEIEHYFEDTENMNYTLKFENGKIVSLVVTGTYEEFAFTYTYEYEYGVNVTVPQDLITKASELK